ncbi:hypothetical protein N2152v2_010849 [Parachlorella kessleri]
MDRCRFGAVHQVEIGVPRGVRPGLRYALVAFASEQAARDAREALDGREEPGVTAAPFKIEYSRARPPGASTTAPPSWQQGGGSNSSSKGPSRGSAGGRSLWVGNLAMNLSEDELAWEMGEYGHVVFIELHPSAGAQTQHAVVVFEREQDAEYAIEDLDGFQGLWIRQVMRWAAAQSAVGKTQPRTTQQQQQQPGAWYGALAFITEPQAPKPGADLFCFVCFASREGAHRAKQALDGSKDSPLCPQNERNRRLKLRYAQPATEDAKARLKPVWQAGPGAATGAGSQAGPRTPVRGPAAQPQQAQQPAHQQHQQQQEKRLHEHYRQLPTPPYSPSHSAPPRRAAAAAGPVAMGNGHHRPASSPAADSKVAEEEDDLPRCASCGVTDDPAAGVALRLCTGCSCLRYCSEDCQLEHWQGGHHAECAVLGSLLGALCVLSPAAKQMLGAGIQRPFGPEAGLLRRVLREAGRI